MRRTQNKDLQTQETPRTLICHFDRWARIKPQLPLHQPHYLQNMSKKLGQMFQSKTAKELRLFMKRYPDFRVECWIGEEVPEVVLISRKKSGKEDGFRAPIHSDWIDKCVNSGEFIRFVVDDLLVIAGNPDDGTINKKRLSLLCRLYVQGALLWPLDSKTEEWIEEIFNRRRASKRR